MASLTACTTTRPQNAWQDKGAQKQRDARSQGAENWGAEPEGPGVSDPVVAAGFLLTLHSLEDRKLNGDFRVDFEGNLELPYDISVAAAGMTLSALKKKLAEVYRPFFKTPSEIDVKVRERRVWLDVRGLVQKPGRLLADANASLDQVIVLAGGFVRESPPQSVRIQKGGRTFSLNLNQYYSRGEERPQVLGWLGGEVLFFQKDPADSFDEKSSSPFRLPVYLLGEVRRPGEYPLRAGSDFIDSIILANGFTDRADLDKIEIVRRTGGRKKSYRFAWDDFQNAPAPMQGDVIIVHADSRTKFDHGIAIATLLVSILSTAAIVWQLERGRE